MTNPTIPENGLDVRKLDPKAFDAAIEGYRRKAMVRGSVDGINGAIRAYLEAARRIPPADNAVAPVCADEAHDHPAHRWELACLHCGVFRGSDLYTVAPSYAEGRAAGLREAAMLVRSLTDHSVIGGFSGDYARRRDNENDALARAAKRIEALIGAAL